MSVLYIILAVVAIVVAWLIATYNGLIRSKNRVDEAFSDIDVQLKRRYDLIPNLIATVKGYAAHEAGTLEKVVQARNAAMSAQGVEAKGKAENALAGTLKSIFALSESYPDLKANTNFLQLQQELSAIEDKVAYARQYYNDGIMTYNVMTKTIPGMWFASLYGHKAKDYLKIP